MPTRNVNLTDHYHQFVENQIVEGRFHNASEVVRAGLRLLEQQTQEEQTKLAALRALAAEAFDEIDKGRGITLNDSRARRDWLGKIRARAMKKNSPRK